MSSARSMVFSCFLKCIAYSALSWSWLQYCLEEHSLLLSGSLINCKLVRHLSSVCLVHLNYAMSSLLFYLTCKIYANTWATPVTSVFSLSKSLAHLVADNLSVTQWDYLMLLARKITLGKAVKVWAKVNDWASKKRGKRVKGKKSSSPIWQACSAISSFGRPDSKLLRSTWRMECCCGKKGLPTGASLPTLAAPDDETGKRMGGHKNSFWESCHPSPVQTLPDPLWRQHTLLLLALPRPKEQYTAGDGPESW